MANAIDQHAHAGIGSFYQPNSPQIRAIEQRPNGSVRYTLDVIDTERPKLRYAPDRVRATTRRPVEGAKIGQGLRGYVRLRPPSGPVRPGGFDFAFNNYFQGIGANGFFLGQPKAISLNQEQWNPKILVEKSRLWLSKHIKGSGSDRSSAVAAALVTGDKAAIPSDVNEALRVAGLAHILSISGLHMALVAGTIMFAFRAIFAAVPNMAAHHPIKKYAALTGFATIFIYLFLAGASIATQRSFIMLSVMLGAHLSDRSALTMRNLAVAAIIVIAISPEAILGPSFQMSFAATIALIAAYSTWSKQRRNVHQETPTDGLIVLQTIKKAASFVLTLAMTAIIAGTATGIFAAYHFHRVAVFGLLGNVLAMPIVTLITMPSAIFATMLIPVGLDSYPYQLMKWSIEQVIQIAEFVANQSPEGIVGAMPNATLLYLILSLVILCAFSSKLRYLGLLFIIPAALARAHDTEPILLVSEDARQFAVITEEGHLAVNRQRPNSFILNQWISAHKITHIAKPDTPGGLACGKEGFCQYDYARNNINLSILYIDNHEYFAVREGEQCVQFDIIVLAYAPAPNACAQQGDSDRAPLVITAQQLALYGSAEVKLGSDDTDTLEVEFALGQTNRPWQSHRQYSRSARNLAPIQRKNQ